MVYPRFSLLFDDLRKVQVELEDSYFSRQGEVEEKAKQLYASNPQSAVAYLTDYSCKTADAMLARWIKLGEYLIVKYNDMVVKPEENGVFKRTPDGIGAPVKNVGYPDATRERIIKETGTKYQVP